MKDGYSFHANYDSLDETYNDYKAAYGAIFTRAGLDFKGIIGDGGAMGGKDSQEFMAITPDRTDLSQWLILDKSIADISEIPDFVIKDIKQELSNWLIAGEDTIAYSDGSDYAANLEMASTEFVKPTAYTEQLELTKVATPDVKTIEEVSAFLDVPTEQTIKTLVYNADGEIVVVLLRGDDELNEVKLTNHLGADFVEPATEDETIKVFGATFGSLGQ